MATRVPADTVAGYLLIMLGAYAPGMAALSLTAWEGGARAVQALLRRILITSVPARYYAFAVFYMVGIRLSAALLQRLLLGSWPAFNTGELFLVPLAIAVSVPFQAGEEIGWRGYALPRLSARFGLAKASLILGVVWAFWHLPQFYIAGADTYHQSFIVWSLQVVAGSVAFAWLYARTGGSLLLVMLLHAAINNSKDIVPAGLPAPPGVFSLHASAVSWLALLSMWAVAAWLLPRMNRTTV